MRLPHHCRGDNYYYRIIVITPVWEFLKETEQESKRMHILMKTARYSLPPFYQERSFSARASLPLPTVQGQQTSALPSISKSIPSPVINDRVSTSYPFAHPCSCTSSTHHKQAKPITNSIASKSRECSLAVPQIRENDIIAYPSQERTAAHRTRTP